MNYIYTSTRNDRKYLLNPQICMGDKVCLIDLTTKENKFVSPKTLKRWYSLNRSNDIYVEVRAFTGMFIGMYPVYPSNDGTELIVLAKNGRMMSFDLANGTQTNAKNPKYSNKITNNYNYMESTLEWTVS